MNGKRRGGWRLWAWGTGKGRRYSLRDAQSEEDVCLYHHERQDPPRLTRGYTSHDHLLDQHPARPHTHAHNHTASQPNLDGRVWRCDSDEGQGVRGIQDGHVRLNQNDMEELKNLENLETKKNKKEIKSLKNVYTKKDPQEERNMNEVEGDDKKDSSSDEDLKNGNEVKLATLATPEDSDSDLECGEKTVCDNKLGGAVQTIVERLRACGVGQGRGGDPEWSGGHDHFWTSQDLRQFLVTKAQLELGGPCPPCFPTPGLEIVELKPRPVNPTITPPPPTPVLPAAPVPMSPRPGPRPTGRSLRGRGRIATLGRHWRWPRGSVQLDQMVRRDMSPPPPRPRLWSLPAIIITTTEDITKSPSPPSHSASLAASMNYLTVPYSPPRARPTTGTTLEDTQSEPGHARQDSSSTEDLASGSRLDSIMELWGHTWLEEEGDGTRKPFAMGSPPPDHRPQSSTEYLEYEESFMYGRYSANLAEYARQEARDYEKMTTTRMSVLFSKELQPYRGKVARTCISFIRPIWDHTFARLGEDWVFLFILGTLMATISFLIDHIVLICFGGRMFLQEYLGQFHWGLQLFSWVVIPTLLVIFSAAFCQWMAPSAAGSGIPEMKTILRGVVLKEYLTWKTLLAKMVSLAAVLGSGLPLGKEGPVMHMASIVATMLTKMLRYIKGSVENDARSTDLLAAACTMGVAVSYAAPIGGVLFSIEVTTVYFAVRNYWRGFFAAVVGAMFYRLMSVWFMGEQTIYPLYKVELNYDYPYDVIELLPFLCIGILCGFAGSLFVYLHRRYVMFMRHNKTLKSFLQKKRLLYPTVVTIAISIMTFPLCFGQFMAATLPSSKQILQLFSNVTWTVTSPDGIMSPEQENILKHWVPDLQGSFHLSLFIFQLVSVFQIAVASTLPVPSGMLIPLFKVGAAFGRQIGELMASLYPLGILPGFPIVPGAYAMVGAASFCAAITHTISISVIVFELTGQITYVIPIMIGVLISNCISSLLQPSIYDSMIRIKKLPYLPDIIATTSSDVYNIYVEDIMVRDVKCIWYGITYTDLKRILKENRKLKYLPLVDKPESMILLGSIQRIELVRMLVEQISPSKRRHEATRRHLEALRLKWEEEDAAGGPKQSKIRYEDEINDDDDDEPATTPSLIHRFSRSLSRSFSRSRSQSRSRSVSRSRHGTPSSDSEDSSISPPGSPASTRSKQDSDSATPPSSPAITQLKEMFPSKSPLARKPSRFSISRVETGTSRTGGESEGEGRSSDDSQERIAKKKSKSKKKKSLVEKDPVKELRRRATIKRSNSLDSLTFRASAQDVDAPDSKKLSEFLSPKKGILKRRNSFSLGSTSTPTDVAPEAHYQTITVADTRLRAAFEKVRRMRMETATSMELKLSQISLFKSKKKDQINKKPQLDLTEEERSVWEMMELAKEVDFTQCHIDPAPFQLVERTSLLRVHSMFSMLGINHAYVTAIGRLIGVLALKEVRMAIDGQYVGQGQSTTPQVSSPNTPTSPMRSSLSPGTSPQRLMPPAVSDPEAGMVSHRGSRTQLVNYANGIAHS
ncbi:hypothetical protein Pcinc_002051 [Petrolisthes cinctipes]|uniref:Chloride channel protein n=1 Tax=Petrolisthes cinctipes TaxID=88211 RepID=A0AAE1L5N1_PETCI|nr:hypothetical protein Pcinc_002051 [Petrolisthes cinctipes]